jgi:hypothetical protein
MTARRPIRLHIERLVVDGLPLTPAQAARLHAALERELARLLVHGGDPSAWSSAGAAQVAAAPAVTWDAARPHQLGRALARSVFASLNGSPRDPAAAADRGAPHPPASRGPSPGGRS